MLAHRNWLESGQFDEDHLSKQEESSGEDRVFLAFVLSTAGNAELALETLERAVAAFPSVGHVRKRLVTELLKQSTRVPTAAATDYLDRAIAHGHAAVALDRDSSSAGSNLGLAYDLKADTLDPSDQTLPRHLDASIHHYSQVLDREPRYLPALVGIANVQLGLGRPRKALEYLATAREVAPDDFSVWHLTGLSYDSIVSTSWLFGPVQQAIESFQKVTQLRPEWWEGHFRLGTALQSDAQHVDAIDSFRKGLQLHPTGRDLRLFLAESLWETEQHRAAMDTLLELLQHHPGDEGAKMLYLNYEAMLPTDELQVSFKGRLR